MRKKSMYMGLLSVLLLAIAAVAGGGTIASAWWFHQPRVPKALSKKRN